MSKDFADYVMFQNSGANCKHLLKLLEDIFIQLENLIKTNFVCKILFMEEL